MGKRALLLSGGAAHGAFQVGVLSELAARGMLGHEEIRGTSVGAVNGAFLYAPVAEQNERGMELPLVWNKEVRGSDSVYRNRFGGMLAAVVAGHRALADTAPLLGILRRYWKGPVPGVGFGVTAVDELSGKVLEFFQDDPDMPQKILASASFPGVFDPVDLERRSPEGARLGISVLTDGGVRDIIPHRSVLSDPEVEEIDVVACKPLCGGVLPLSPGRKYGVLDRVLRTVEIMVDELFLGDIADLLASGRKVRFWAPETPIATDPLDFRPTYQKLLMEMGKKVVRDG